LARHSDKKQISVRGKNFVLTTINCKICVVDSPTYYTKVNCKINKQKTQTKCVFLSQPVAADRGPFGNLLRRLPGEKTLG
jgi:hypothetical protein